MRVVVLGAGFGGLELTTRLSEELGDDVDVTLIDKADGFIFGFSKLDVMFGKAQPDAVHHAYADIVKPGVRFVQTTITAIDPVAKHVETDAGAFDADVLVVALGADLHPEATPGLLEAGHEFYTVPGAFACRDVLDDFDGGRVIVAVTSTPFKCPPAPERDRAARARLPRRSAGCAIDRRSPWSCRWRVPIPPSPAASQALLVAFEERGITFHGEQVVRELDPATKVARMADGGEMPFDLFLGIPVHRVPQVVEESGMTVDGWIPVDPSHARDVVPRRVRGRRRHERRHPEGRRVRRGPGRRGGRRDHRPGAASGDASQYDGRGICYLEFGNDEVAKVDVIFDAGPAAHRRLPGAVRRTSWPTSASSARSRIQRWFGRTWSTTG